MDAQTDGIEWVMATLFLLGGALVVFAAVREVLKFRRGDAGGEDMKKKP